MCASAPRRSVTALPVCNSGSQLPSSRSENLLLLSSSVSVLPLCAQACCRTLEIEEKLRSVTVTAFVRRPAHGRGPTLLSTTELLLLLSAPAPLSAPCCGEHDFCHSCAGAPTYQPEADDKLPRYSACGMSNCAAAPGCRCRVPELRPATSANAPVLCVSSFMTQNSRSLLNSCTWQATGQGVARLWAAWQHGQCVLTS